MFLCESYNLTNTYTTQQIFSKNGVQLFLYVPIAWKQLLFPTEAAQFVYWYHNDSLSRE